MDNQRSYTYGTANLFYSEVVKWKQIASKLWSTFIVLALVLFHCVTVKQGTLLDLNGLFIGFFATFISLQFWAYSLCVCVFFWLTFSFNDILFRVSPKVYASNYDKLVQVLWSAQFLSLLVNVTAAVAISLLLLQFYSESQNTFYITGFCAFSTTLMRLRFIFGENFLLNWPITEQAKYARFKAKFYNVMLYTLKSTFTTWLLWHLAYFLTANVLDLSQANRSSSSVGLLSTISIALKLAFTINFCYLINWYLLEIYLTEIYHFPLQQSTPSELTLPMAMSLNDRPYIQHLALVQLNYLSIYSKQGRKSLFSLNYNSGQPTNWIKISSEALNNIRCFMDIFNFDDMLHGSGKMIGNFDKTGTNRYPSLSMKRQTLTSPVQSPIRQLNQVPFNDRTFTKSPKTSNIAAATRDKILNSTFFKDLIESVMRKKLFHLIYNQNLNYKTEQLFIDSFLVINSLKALSNLAIASYNEDEYGIVQQTLPEILTSFINLQKMLEKFVTSNTNASISFKILQKSSPGHIKLLMQKLSFILNESIYKLTQTFGSSLKSLGLSEEISKRLDKYYVIN